MADTYDLATDIGKVRRDIGDKSTTAAVWSDAEIQSFLDEGGSVKAAAGLCLLAWAAALAREDESVDTGSWKGDRRDVAAKMTKAAEGYLKLAGYTPAALQPTFRQAVVDWTPEVASERETWEQTP